MAFWDAYRASLKPAEIEEPIDRLVHRPLGYIVAKAGSALGISADAITVGSVLLGWTGAGLLLSPARGAVQAGALLVFLSAVFDCADGQLARMRGVSSVFGRMLDGCADLLVSCAVAPATVYLIWRRYSTPLWLGGTVVGLCAVSIYTSTLHTAAYDHYKYAWLRATGRVARPADGTAVEGESYANARARFEASRAATPAWKALVWQTYLFYLHGQEGFLRWFDPATGPALGGLGAHDAATEAAYRAAGAKPFAWLRGFYGFGSLVFGLALFDAIERPDLLLLFRLVVMDPFLFFYIRPAQRRASALLLRAGEASAAGR